MFQYLFEDMLNVRSRDFLINLLFAILNLYFISSFVYLSKKAEQFDKKLYFKKVKNEIEGLIV